MTLKVRANLRVFRVMEAAVRRCQTTGPLTPEAVTASLELFTVATRCLRLLFGINLLLYNQVNPNKDLFIICISLPPLLLLPDNPPQEAEEKLCSWLSRGAGAGAGARRGIPKRAPIRDSASHVWTL